MRAIGVREDREQSGGVPDVRRMNPLRPVPPRTRREDGLCRFAGERAVQTGFEARDDVEVVHERFEPADERRCSVFDVVIGIVWRVVVYCTIVMPPHALSGAG